MDQPDEDALDAAFQQVLGQVRLQFRTSDRRTRRRPRRGEQAVAKKNTQEADNVSPVTKFARMLGDYKTTTEVAEALGVSDSLVRKWRAKGVAGAPSFVTEFGEHEMALYTDEDIENLRQFQRRSQRVRPTKTKKGRK